jgi:hypothetical protein
MIQVHGEAMITIFAPPEVIKAAKNKEYGAPLIPESDLYSLGLVARVEAFGRAHTNYKELIVPESTTPP